MAMHYFLESGGKITLTDNDFVAEGGEGKIYAKDAYVYKIYIDPQQMIPVPKIRELAVLNRPHIIRPEMLLLDANNNPVGFRMQRVQQAVSLPRLFTNDFRDRYQIDNSKVLTLLEKMQETIAFIHKGHCLMVDGNEMNYLVDETTFELIYFIDVDSYQTPSYPATAIMPSIRDYHSTNFSPLTDWFAFAIVACQLLIGIHPYKGKHPDFKKHDLQARMQANISIFNRQVSLPAAVRDFSLIPKALQDWFIKLFEKGERLLPPAIGKAIIAPIRVQVITGTDNFIITLRKEFPAPIRQHHSYNAIQIVSVGRQVYLDKTVIPISDPTTQIVYESRLLTPLAATIHDQLLQIENLSTRQILPLQIKANSLFTVQNRLYIVQQGYLTEIKITTLADKLIVSTGTTWNIMPNAHQVLEGFLYQSVLGQPYLVIPYQTNACVIKSIPELKTYTIVNGKYDKGVALLIGRHKPSGRYDQLIIRFDAQHNHYQVRILENQEVLDNNFVTLDNGTVVFIPTDGELEIFHRYNEARKTIQDPQVRTNMHLSCDGNVVLFYTDNKLYQIQVNQQKTSKQL